jgi:DnaK suppressor protein
MILLLQEKKSMTGKEKEKIRKHVTEKMLSLQKNIVSYKELSKPVSPDNAIGRLTRMEAISSRSISQEALRKAEYSLARLKKVITIIDDEDFGLCRECEEPIPFARLMILPESDLCVRCAEKGES